MNEPAVPARPAMIDACVIAAPGRLAGTRDRGGWRSAHFLLYRVASSRSHCVIRIVDVPQRSKLPAVHRSPPPAVRAFGRRRSWAAAVLALALWLGLCASAFAQPADDELAQETAARARILSGLTQGLASYRLVPGDVLEVLFLTRSAVEAEPYRIHVGDRLRVEFHFVDEAPRTVGVRPDGMITLPYKGDVPAAERAPAQLAAELQSLYADVWREPRITVTVEQFTSRLEDLRLTLSNSQRGRSQRVVLGPDGLAFLPFLPGLRLAGLSVDQARERINAEYRQRLGGLEVSVLLDGMGGNRIFVFGEVPRPGLVAGGGNFTVLQAVASAGGVLPSAAADMVRVLSWSDAAGSPQMRSVDLQRIAGEGRTGEDLLLVGQSVIYVPPTGLVKTGRFVDQFLRQLLLFNGITLGINHELRR